MDAYLFYLCVCPLWTAVARFVICLCLALIDSIITADKCTITELLTGISNADLVWHNGIWGLACFCQNKFISGGHTMHSKLENAFWLTQHPFDWTIGTSYRVHYIPIAIFHCIPIANCKCRQSKIPFVIYRHASCTCATIDLHFCTVRPIDCFDLYIRNVRPANWRDCLICNSIRDRFVGNAGDTLRTFVLCGFAWHSQALLKLILKSAKIENKIIEKHMIKRCRRVWNTHRQLRK